jgi:hypothetical protein
LHGSCKHLRATYDERRRSFARFSSVSPCALQKRSYNVRVFFHALMPRAADAALSTLPDHSPHPGGSQRVFNQDRASEGAITHQNQPQLTTTKTTGAITPTEKPILSHTVFRTRPFPTEAVASRGHRGVFAVRRSPFAPRADDFALRPGHFAVRADDFASRAGHFAARAGPFALRADDFAVRASPFAVCADDFASRPSHFAACAGHFAVRANDFAVRWGRFALRLDDFAVRRSPFRLLRPHRALFDGDVRPF